MIQSHDHLPKLIVDALKDLKEQYHNTVIISNIIREVARLNLRDSKDSAGVKNVAGFITELASTLPVSMLHNISVLLPHLDAENYAVRSAIISCLGSVVRQVFSPDGLGSDQQTPSHDAEGTENNSPEEDKNAEDNHSSSGAFSVKTRDALIDVVEERFYDIHALTRAAAIRTSYQIVTSKALPIERWTSLTAKAVDRLQDKSSLTRRAALQLLTSLLENNPFSPQLDPHVLQRQIADIDCKLKEANTEDSSQEPSEEPDAEQERLKKMSMYCQTTLQFANTMSTCIPTVSKLLGSKTSSDVLEAISFLRRARAFGLPSADEALSKMLTLIWTSEKSVKEAILDAFIIEYLTDPVFSGSDQEAQNSESSNDQFEIEGHMRVFRQPMVAANTLIKLTIGASLAIRTSMERTLEILAEKNYIQEGLLEALWQYVGKSLSVLTEQARRSPDAAIDDSKKHKQKKSITYGRAAMNILSMLARSIPQAVDSEQGLKRLLAVLAGPGAIRSGAVGGCDYRLAHYACEAAQKVCAVLGGKPGTPAAVASTLQKTGDSKETEVTETNKKKTRNNRKCEVTDEKERDKCCRSKAIANLIICIVSMVRGDWDNGVTPDRHWYSAAESGIEALFVLAPRPEKVCESIIRSMTSSLFLPEALKDAENLDAANSEDMPSCLSMASFRINQLKEYATEGRLSKTLLSRLFFALGHVALKSLVFLEEMADASKRTRQHLSDRKEKQAQASKKQDTAGKSKRRKSVAEEGSLEDQLGTVGGSDDQEAELVAHIAENELVTSGLLGVFAPLLAQVAADGKGEFGKEDQDSSSAGYIDPLRQSAVLALSKFMCMSANLCEQYLQLMFTILKRARSPALRATVAIALGDLAFRFPNQVEPWTEHLYLCLRDTNPSVRKNTLMVLTHLILNDMIKVKGQVAEIAACLQDEDERICDLTMLFFHELSKRGSNPIYNIMPDIIACLANHPRLKSSTKSSEESFKSIMKYLLSFISKDKHVDALIERLLGRLGAIRHEIESTDIENSDESKTSDNSDSLLMVRHLAFCLSQLPYSEKGYKKVMESYKLYKHALKDEKVVAYFNAMLAKAKKFAKAENKANITEWEQCLSSAHQGNEETPQETSLKENDESESAVRSTENDDNSNISTGKKVETHRRQTRPKRNSRRHVEPDESEEDDETVNSSVKAPPVERQSDDEELEL